MTDELREILRGGITLTAYADEAIDSGDLVKASNATDDVVTSAGVSSYATSDIHVSMCNAAGDNLLCVGIALEDASAAADYITVATDGLYIMRASAAIAEGVSVAFANSTDPQEIVTTTTALTGIGKSLTGASAADTYLIVLLRVAG